MIFLKAAVHLTQMGLALLKPLMVLLLLDVTGLHRKSIPGAVTSVMALPRVTRSLPGVAPALACVGEDSGDF